MSTTGLSDCSMLELFRLELEGQSVNLNDGLLALERAPGALEHIEPLMRAAHSLKGAARIVGLDVAVRVAHAMEDFLVAAQHGRVALRQPEIDALLNGVDLLTRIGNTPEPQLAVWEKEQAGEIQSFLDRIKGLLTTGKREDNSPVATLPNTEATVQPAGEVGDGHAQFRAETELQLTALAESLAASNGPPAGPEPLPALISAAQAIKDAARTVNCAAAIRVAHALEDIFTSAQNTGRACQPSEQEAARRAVEWLQQLAASQPAEFSKWEAERAAELETFVDELRTCLLTTPTPVAEPCAAASPASPKRAAKGHEHHERVLRISAENLNRLLGMVGESLVESRWIHPFTSSMLRLKRLQAEIEKSLEGLRESLPRQGSDEKTQHQLHSTQTKVAECRQFLSERLVELEQFDRHSSNLSQRLYRQAVNCRMRPFADGTHGFPRMIRDLAKQLGKEVRLEMVGETTQVDRDVLEKLEAPLTHLLRNALDHGIETPAERRAAGKPPEATLRLEARHRAGMLQIVVADDGRGINFEKLRAAIVKKKLATSEMAARLTEAEAIEFLFLPGFSTKEQVTEVSGRGVGLDVVQVMVSQVRGTVRAESRTGLGMKFQLQLPLTLSVTRMLLVTIAGEHYAFPLAHIGRTLKLSISDIEVLEGRQYFKLGEQLIGLVTSHQVLDLPAPPEQPQLLSVLVVGERGSRYGVVVERFLGERELVVQAFDPRLGKLRNLNSAALMPDGSPVLVVDVEDLIRSIEQLATNNRVADVNSRRQEAHEKAKPRVLVVDDSLTVREIERKLLENRGYNVQVAVDGMEAWNAVRAGSFDLVITDVDMPRLDGIELVRLIKADAKFKTLPVMIVSYRDRVEDQNRGLEAGADYYLTKASFHDDSLLNAVADLIGEAGE